MTEPRHISEILEISEAACERITRKTVAQWTEERNARLKRDIKSGRVKRNQLYTDFDMVKMRRRYGFELEDFMAVEVALDDTEPTDIERIALAKPGGEVTVTWKGTDRRMQILQPLRIVTRYQLRHNAILRKLRPNQLESVAWFNQNREWFKEDWKRSFPAFLSAVNEALEQNQLQPLDQVNTESLKHRWANKHPTQRPDTEYPANVRRLTTYAQTPTADRELPRGDR